MIISNAQEVRLPVALCHKTRNTTNVLIVGLAVADLVFIVVCVPFTAAIYALPTWPFGIPFCKVSQFVFSPKSFTLRIPYTLC